MDIIREDCIYARQSVDRKDSISIESQIDFCKYELKGGNCRRIQRQRIFREKHRQTGISKTAWRNPKRKSSAGNCLQAGQNQSFYSRLRKYDGTVSRIRCGVCIFHRKI